MLKNQRRVEFLAGIMTGAITDEDLRRAEMTVRSGRARKRAERSMPPRGECKRVDVLGGVLRHDAHGRPVRDVLTASDGAWARPLWSLSIPPELKHVGARYGALVELVERGGEARCVDMAAARVDGGGACGREFFRLDAIRRLDLARSAIGTETVFGYCAPADEIAIPKMQITARMLVDAVCVSERSVGTVLRLSGRCSKGRPFSTARDALAAALERIANIWG